MNKFYKFLASSSAIGDSSVEAFRTSNRKVLGLIQRVATHYLGVSKKRKVAQSGTKWHKVTQSGFFHGIN